MHARPTDVPSKAELLAALAALRAAGLDSWRGIDPAHFWRAAGGGWSPADNVRHLTMSTAPVARALRLPRVLLGLLFGRSADPSRPRDVLRDDYRDRLARGATAGRYTPSPERPPHDAPRGQRRLVDRCAATIVKLERALRPWTESDLDRFGLPHPILGRLSLREMTMFTLFHFAHHEEQVARRSAAAPSRP